MGLRRVASRALPIHPAALVMVMVMVTVAVAVVVVVVVAVVCGCCCCCGRGCHWSRHCWYCLLLLLMIPSHIHI